MRIPIFKSIGCFEETLASIRNWFDVNPHDYSPYRIIDEKSFNDLSKIEEQIVDPGDFDIFSVETEDKGSGT